MNHSENNHINWSENIIIADADFIDDVAFNLIVNFERIIGRPIPQADLPKWLESVALDGGIRPKEKEEGQQQTQVVLLKKQNQKALNNFIPGDYEQELEGKAFKGPLGEFIITILPKEQVVTTKELFTGVLKTILPQKQVKRIIIIPDTEDNETIDLIKHTLRDAPEDKNITMLTMEPVNGRTFKQEILGYSLMNALGIKSEEIK